MTHSVNNRLIILVHVYVLFATLVLQATELASTESIVHYSIPVQNKLPFSVNLKTVWVDGTENNQKLNPCGDLLLRYPHAKYTSRFAGTRVHRKLLRSLEITSDTEYYNYYSGESIESQLSNIDDLALELSPKLGQGEVYFAPQWSRCVRLLNATTDYKTIVLHYNDRTRKEFSLVPNQFIFFGTDELGQFQRKMPSFWNPRKFFAYHDVYVKRLLVLDGAHVVHELNHKDTRRVFSKFYSRPPTMRGTCMELNEKGFNFVGDCSSLQEICVSNECRFASE